MSNKVNIKQIHKIDKVILEAVSNNKNLYIERLKAELDNVLIEFISNHYPVQEVDTDGNIELKRELFIFNEEQLVEFINNYAQGKQYKHEV